MGRLAGAREPTPIDYIDTVYFASRSRMMAEMARPSQETTRRPHIASCSGRSRRPSTRSTCARTAPERGHADRLCAGPVRRSDSRTVRASTGQMLAEMIRDNDNRMSTGFLGTRPLLPVLSAIGQHDSGRVPVPEPQVPVVGLRSRARRDDDLGTLEQLHQGKRVRPAQRRDELLRALLVRRGLRVDVPDWRAFNRMGRATGASSFDRRRHRRAAMRSASQSTG